MKSQHPIFAALFLLGAVSSHAATIVDSISGTTGTTAAFLDGIGKAVSFTIGASSYTLDSVSINLTRDATATDPTFTVGIFSSTNNSGLIKPSTSLVSLTAPVIPVNTNSATLFTMTPTVAFTLAANTTYFFVIYNTSTSGVKWMYDSSSAVTSGGVTIPTDVDPVTGGNQIGWFPNSGTLTNPSTWNGATGVYNDFKLDATLVPEPSALMLAAAAAVIPCLRRRREGMFIDN